MAHFLPRFTTLQLLLAAALCGLILGLATAAWRTAQYARITAIAFSPNGQRLAARYSGGGFQAWRIGQSSPRLVARTRMEQLFSDDWGPVRFADDDTLVDIRTLVPDISQQIRYAGPENFVGVPVEGYGASRCYLRESAAQALQRVEQSLRREGFRLRLFDGDSRLQAAHEQ